MFVLCSRAYVKIKYLQIISTFNVNLGNGCNKNNSLAKINFKSIACFYY